MNMLKITELYMLGEFYDMWIISQKLWFKKIMKICSNLVTIFFSVKWDNVFPIYENIKFQVFFVDIKEIGLIMLSDMTNM